MKNNKYTAADKLIGLGLIVFMIAIWSMILTCGYKLYANNLFF